MPVLTFANMKGGVGKTTFAFLTATCMPRILRRDMKILAIDIDPQAHLTRKFITEEDYGTLAERNIAHFFQGKLSLQECIMPTIVDYVWLVPSTITLSVIETEVFLHPAGTAALKYGLAPLVNSYDLVVIDAPPNAGVFALNAIVAADVVVCPISTDMMALEGFKHMNETMRRLAMTPLGQNKKLYLLLNLMDKRYSMHKVFIEKIREYYRDYVIGVVSRRASIQKATEFPNSQAWLMIASTDTDASDDLRRVLTKLGHILLDGEVNSIAQAADQLEPLETELPADWFNRLVMALSRTELPYSFRWLLIQLATVANSPKFLCTLNFAASLPGAPQHSTLTKFYSTLAKVDGIVVQPSKTGTLIDLTGLIASTDPVGPDGTP